jgi:hypothetical protein
MVDDDDVAPGGRMRVIAWVAVAGLLGASFVVGALIWGVRGSAAPSIADGASGCTVHPLRFTVTDDPAEFARQQRFEATDTEVPRPGLYDRALDEVATLHAASHAFVVVFVRSATTLDSGTRAALHRFDDAARATKAPVLIVRREQTPALVALSRGYALRCATAGAAQVAEVRRFAAQEYASVRDPHDPVKAAPAPTTPHDAPSPASQRR